ncbi:MAG: S41 family peptidase [Bacteroidetes bacterium]|nr:S41 family peptidase [Bacteroidota bacterium]
MINSFLKIHFAVATVLFISFVSNAQKSEVNSGYKIGEIIDQINRFYVDEVNEKELTEKAIVALLEQLDPHSSYIPKEEVEDANEKINGSFVGIGIRFQILKDTLVVVQTIPGGPSEKVGILAGDKIVIIESENIAGVGLKNSQVREKLLGEKGTKVKIEIVRSGTKKTQTFTITRDKIPVFSVDTYYMVTPEIGYIKLNSFSRTTLEELETGLASLKAQGMQNLVFDLQGNGGGLLYAAQKVADLFLTDDKLVVYSEGKSQPRSDLKSGEIGPWEKGKMIILTDEYTASASEIVSGAIQDWDRGLIVGRRTFGKGLVQRPINLSDGSQIRLTIARYYTPSGRFIQKPYDDVNEYRKDLTQRYLNGEFTNLDSIKLPDSLKHNTLITKRTVYSGGGIMPDIFVPLDTTQITDLYRVMARGGYFNSFVLTYLQQNRRKLEKEYPNFEKFKSTFQITENLEKEFLNYIAKENKEFKVNTEELAQSKQLIDSRLKATFAQDLWGTSEFYQIYNDNNEILQKAIKILNEKEYDQMKLAELK